MDKKQMNYKYQLQSIKPYYNTPLLHCRVRQGNNFELSDSIL